jgi:DNA-binding NarL/FixJ family response regulator
MTSLVIVDDDDDLRLLLRVTLTDRGYTIVGEAGDGTDGVAVAARLQPDAILLDLSMPGLGGLAVLPLLAEVAPATPVVVLTSDADPRTAQEVHALGASGLVTKPTTVDRLARAIDDATTAAEVADGEDGLMA